MMVTVRLMLASFSALCMVKQVIQAGFSMGCKCGIRKVDKNAEADCEESARLEGTNQAGNVQSLHAFHVRNISAS